MYINKYIYIYINIYFTLITQIVDKHMKSLDVLSIILNKKFSLYQQLFLVFYKTHNYLGHQLLPIVHLIINKINFPRHCWFQFQSISGISPCSFQVRNVVSVGMLALCSQCAETWYEVLEIPASRSEVWLWVPERYSKYVLQNLII